MVREINMGVCPRLDFDNIMLFNCLGYNFNIYGAFEFLCNSFVNGRLQSVFSLDYSLRTTRSK